MVDEEAQIPDVVCAVDCCWLTFACWDRDRARSQAVNVRAGLCKAVKNCFGFPAVDGKACSLEPGQALSKPSDEASTHQMI